jgi:hypothetical protein
MSCGGLFDCWKQHMKQNLYIATLVEELKNILVTLLNVHFLHIKSHQQRLQSCQL